jgi:hypothetical protein
MLPTPEYVNAIAAAIFIFSVEGLVNVAYEVEEEFQSLLLFIPAETPVLDARSLPFGCY